MKMTLVSLAALSLCGLFAISCGGDDTTADASSTGGSSFPETNGCDPAAAEDHSADGPDVTVNFGANAGNQNIYDPACITISAGQNVVFKGNFVGHNLEGGTATAGALTPDASSPIPTTKSGAEVSVPFPTAGSYPYYCIQHGKIGMKGAVFVQ